MCHHRKSDCQLAAGRDRQPDRGTGLLESDRDLPARLARGVLTRTAAWMRTVNDVARRRYAGEYEVFFVHSDAKPG